MGDEDLHLDEWWEQPVSVDFLFHTREEMERALRDAGFEIEEVVERDPYPDVETQTRRAYVFAVSPI